MKKFGVLLASLLTLISASVHAGHLLQFKEGQKAAYTIEQTTKGKIEGPRALKGDIRVHNTLGFTIEIISVDPSTGDFPMEVEVKVNKLTVDMALTAHEAGNTLRKTLRFDGKKGTKGMDQIVQHLKSKPLRFKVNRNFKISPKTNRLEKIEDSLDDLSAFPGGALVFGANELQWKQTLGQMFHLADQKSGKQTYKVLLLKLLDEDLDDADIIKDNGQYAFTNAAGASVLTANWTGDVHAKDNDLNTEDALNFAGKVSWNKGNPLVQTRNVTFHAMENDKDSDGGKVNATVHQKWTSRAL